MHLYILGKNTDDKGTQLEQLTRLILEHQGLTDICSNVAGIGGNEVDVYAMSKRIIVSKEVCVPVVCECKAYKSPIDTTAWLKFIGKVQLERFKNDKAIGLMIALSGANGSVVGSYHDIEDREFVQLLANDSLTSLVKELFDLISKKEIEEIAANFTDREIADIDIIFYNKKVYWLVSYNCNDYSLFNKNGSLLDNVGELSEMIKDATSFCNFIDVKLEQQMMINSAYSNNMAIKCLMDKTWEKKALLNEISASIRVDAENVVDFLADNPFIVENDGCYMLKENIDFVDFYSYVLSRPLSISILSAEYYISHIDDCLLKKICDIQSGIEIPEEKKADCILILQLSPSALKYALTPDRFFDHHKLPMIKEKIDRLDFEYFEMVISNMFAKDFIRNHFSELYLEKYGINNIISKTSFVFQTKKDRVVQLNTISRMEIAKIKDYNTYSVIQMLDDPA